MKEGQITTAMIRYAYERGVFPMGETTGEVAWYEPSVRALFPMTGIRVSQSLKRTLRKGLFEVTFDNCFEQVMRGCLRPTDNWINEELISVYTQIHREGWGHCAECWQDGELVGGVYGIAIGGCFCAESMFHRKTDASKVALKALIDHCRELEFSMFDAQLQNPHLASLGAFEIPRREYLKRLRAVLKQKTAWSPF